MSMTKLRSDWLIGYYALVRDKFSAKTISIDRFHVTSPLSKIQN